MNHTSRIAWRGLRRRLVPMLALAGFAMASTASAAATLPTSSTSSSGRQPRVGESGKAWNYSNAGYMLLGDAGGIEGTDADPQTVWETGVAAALTSNEGPGQAWLFAEHIADLLAAAHARP